MRQSIDQQDVLGLDVMTVKRCSFCSVEKPVAAFVPSRPTYCRACWNKKVKAYRATIPLEQRQRDLDRMAAWGLGIKRQQIEEQRAKQGGLCAICGVTLSRGRAGSGQTVDHDHKTFKPRGLLCKECNKRVGWYDLLSALEPDYLAKLVDYVANPPWGFAGDVDVENIQWRMRHRKADRWSRSKVD